MAVSSLNLAEALASRLDDVAPEGLSVGANGEQLSVYRGDLLLGGSAAPGILDGEFDDRQVETAGWARAPGPPPGSAQVAG